VKGVLNTSFGQSLQKIAKYTMSKITPNIHLFDKSFSENKTIEYELFIQLSKDGFKYTILDFEKKTFIALVTYQFAAIYNNFLLLEPLKKIITSSPLLKKEFKSVNFSYISNRATLVPNAIFLKDELKTFHQFNFSTQEEDAFFYDKLINLDAYNVYSIPDFIVNEFKTLKKITFKHFSTSLIEASILHAKTNKMLSLVDVNVLPSSFQIIVVKNQKLVFYNSFNYQTSEDFIYYLLFVLEQLSINNEEATIRLLGEVEKDAAIYTILCQYVKTINFAKSPENLKLSYILEGIPEHIHYSLFHQFL